MYMSWLRTEKVIHEAEKGGNLYYLLSALLGAYNRRTDVMERAVKLDERIESMRRRLDTAGESLKETVERNQPTDQED